MLNIVQHYSIRKNFKMDCTKRHLNAAGMYYFQFSKLIKIFFIVLKLGSTVLDPRSKPVGPRRRKPERRVTKGRGRRVDTSRRRHFFRDEEICVTRLSSLQMRQSPQRVRRGCRNGPRTLGNPFLFLNLWLTQDFIYFYQLILYWHIHFTYTVRNIICKSYDQILRAFLQHKWVM